MSVRFSIPEETWLKILQSNMKKKSFDFQITDVLQN